MLQSHPQATSDVLFSAMYHSCDTLKEMDNVMLLPIEQSPEFLTSMTHPNVPPHTLHLKPNAICAIQHNFAVEKGLVRNVRVQIVALHRRFMEVRQINSNEVHCIPQINFDFHPTHTDWTVLHQQFPLRLAYATTFNGCQGLTLSKAALDLHIDPFAHGQLYTALSRVCRREDILIVFSETNEEQTTANIVFPSLLL